MGELMAFTADVREFSQDRIEIAQRETYFLQDNEQNEKSYMELVD
jgi:hypothetical protein